MLKLDPGDLGMRGEVKREKNGESTFKEICKREAVEEKAGARGEVGFVFYEGRSQQFMDNACSCSSA